MSFFQNLLGIIGVEFQFNHADDSGGLASKWISVDGAIEAKNGDGSVYVIGRGATPVGPSDWVTLQYANDNFSNTNSVQEIRFAVGASTSSSVTPLAAGQYVVDAEVKITSPYDPGTTMSLAAPSTPLMSTADINTQNPTLYSVRQDQTVAAPGSVTATVTPGGGVGDAIAIVRFVEAPLP